MTTSSLRAANWRRVLLVGITALIALLAISFAAPAESRANHEYEYGSHDPSRVYYYSSGYAYVKGGFVAGTVCTVIDCNANAKAYRWVGNYGNNNGWTEVSLPKGMQVEVQPYSVQYDYGYVWVRVGYEWLLIRTNQLETGYRR